MMRPRARTEATPVKVVHSPPQTMTTTTRMREGRRASSGVLAGRIDPGSQVASRLCLRSTCRPTRTTTSVFHFRLPSAFRSSPPPLLFSLTFVFVWKKQRDPFPCTPPPPPPLPRRG